jgi:hypothetical protein
MRFACCEAQTDRKAVCVDHHMNLAGHSASFGLGKHERPCLRAGDIGMAPR